jgi:hypothetical protein
MLGRGKSSGASGIFAASQQPNRELILLGRAVAFARQALAPAERRGPERLGVNFKARGLPLGGERRGRAVVASEAEPQVCSPLKKSFENLSARLRGA